MGVYWPELSFSVTSPQVTIPEYLRRAKEAWQAFHALVAMGFDKQLAK